MSHGTASMIANNRMDAQVEVARQPGVSSSLTNLHEAVALLEKAICRLGEKLMPVLCDDMPAAGSDGCNKPSAGSKVALTIQEAADGVDAHVARINNLVSRLDI